MSTILADSRSAVDVQAAIGLALPGDRVVVPAGEVTWDSAGVTCAKGITLDFSGVTVTRGTGTNTLIEVTTHATDRFRLTGGTFEQTVGGAPYAKQVTVNGSSFTNAKFRIDNCTFRSTKASSILVVIYKAWGLIDNCDLYGDNGSEMLHNEAFGPSDASGWGDVVTPGSGDAVYVEDCTFSKYDQTSAYFWGTSGLQSYYGSRTVVRYSTFNYCQIDQHGTPGMIGARWWELYNNDFVIPEGGSRNQSSYMDLRAGSGVIWGNTKSGGTNLGAGNLSLREEDTGAYPELYQIGRGKDQELTPAYCWDNFKAPIGQETYVIDGRDFYSTTELGGYTPYTYPHPLRQIPESPTDLAAASNGSSSISLSWTDASSNETGFTVERSLNGTTGWAEIADLPAGSTAYADTGLSSGTAYYYRVAAYNEYGSSAYSDTANATTELAPVVAAGESMSAPGSYAWM